MAVDLDFLDLETETPSERRARVLARSDSELLLDLIALRKSKGITQAALASRMGVTQATVASFERYDSDPKLSTVRRYAHAIEALIKHVVEPDVGQHPAGAEWRVVSLHLPSVSAGSRANSVYATSGPKRTDYAVAA